MKQKQKQERFEKVIEMDENISIWWYIYLFSSMFGLILISFVHFNFNIFNFNIKGLEFITGFSISLFLVSFYRLLSGRKIYYRRIE